jgi:SRSO17 transposase
MEWPAGAGEPSGYWLGRLPVKLSLKRLVGISKQRWVIERDYEELKQELGLGHYEGRNWHAIRAHRRKQ